MSTLAWSPSGSASINRKSASPETAPRRREFVGDRFLLNELHAEIRDQEGARDAPSRAGTVSPDELLWHTPSIERALFTPYGCNYQFLAHMLRGSPCVFTPGKVVVVDEYDHSKYAPAVHPPSPARPFSVVPPKFGEGGAAQAAACLIKRPQPPGYRWPMPLSPPTKRPPAAEAACEQGKPTI